MIYEKEPHPSLKQEIEKVGDKATRVFIAGSYSEAKRCIDKRRYYYCVLDLGLPEHRYGNPIGIADPNVCRWGFAVFREIKEQCPDVEVSILSRFIGDPAVTAMEKKLLGEGLRPRAVWNKNRHCEEPGLRSDWYVDKIKRDVGGLDQKLVTLLGKVGVRVVHPLERRLARGLWQRSGAKLEWPRPVVVLRGETRSGKDKWAEGFSAFIDARHPLTGGEKRRRGSRDLGQVSGPAGGESGKVALFGCRNFGGQVADTPGVFEQATAYLREGRQVDTFGGRARLAKRDDAVDYDRSGVAFLRELGNLPGECQQLLLGVLDSNPEIGGRIRPAGATGEELRIGCAMVFTTNAAIEERVRESDACRPGEFREDLFRRLRKPDSWFEVPSLARMGAAAFFKHLEVALGAARREPVELASGTEAYLQEAADGGVDMDTVNGIVLAFRESSDTVLMPEHIVPVLPQSAERRRTTKVTGGEEAWTLDRFVAEGVVQRSTREYEYLRLGMRNEGVKLGSAAIRRQMGAEGGGGPTDRAISAGLSRLRDKLGRHDCGWVLEKPKLLLKRVRCDA